MPNPHDRLTPKESALIIRKHVPDGVKMAIQSGLPQSVVDIISQHHGDSTVSYFYYMAKQQGETIRIAAYASMAMFWLPEILYRFRRICPKVDVDLRMVDHALEPFELLQEGKTDVIFASRQSSESSVNGCPFMMNYCMLFCQKIIR